MGIGDSHEGADGSRSPRVAWLMHFLRVLVLALASLTLASITTHAPRGLRSARIDAAQARSVGKTSGGPFGLQRSQRSSHRVDERARAVVDVEAVEVDVSEDGLDDELRHFEGALQDAASRVDAWRRHRLLGVTHVELQNDPSQLGFARPFPRGPPAARA